MFAGEEIGLFPPKMILGQSSLGVQIQICECVNDIEAQFKAGSPLLVFLLVFLS